MLIQCDNKGCHKQNAPLLSVKENTVICGECGNIINNVTQFTKVTLKSLNQVQKDTEVHDFAVKCKNCTKTGTPYLKKDIAYCSGCNHNLELTEPFIQMLKIFRK